MASVPSGVFWVCQKLKTPLRDAGLTAADATTVTAEYADAQLNALKTSMLTVAFLAVLSFWFTRRLPGKREEAV